MRIITCVLLTVCAFPVGAAGGQETKRLEIVSALGGEGAVSEQRLLDETNKCLAKYSHPRDGYNPHVLNDCVLSLLAHEGYLRAVVGTPEVHKLEGGITKVSVSVDEGLRYRLGEVVIKGPTLFSPQQLTEMLDLKPGDVAGGAFYRWLDERVRRAYADRGHIQYNYEVEPAYRPAPGGVKEGVVDFKVIIDEGLHFTIRRIKFVGNKHAPEHVLRRALSIREGETFIQSLYEDSIENLNKLGLFEEVGERDIDLLSAGRDVPQVDVVIKLRERARP